MINRIKTKKQLEQEFLGFIPELSDIQKLDLKISYAQDVIKGIQTEIIHAYGVRKALLQWDLLNVENTQARAEVLRDILVKKYQKF